MSDVPGEFSSQTTPGQTPTGTVSPQVREAARARAEDYRRRAAEMLKLSQQSTLPRQQAIYRQAAAKCLALSEQELRVADSKRGL
jgi:hypothetical protein